MSYNYNFYKKLPQKISLIFAHLKLSRHWKFDVQKIEWIVESKLPRES